MSNTARTCTHLKRHSKVKSKADLVDNTALVVGQRQVRSGVRKQQRKRPKQQRRIRSRQTQRSLQVRRGTNRYLRAPPFVASEEVFPNRAGVLARSALGAHVEVAQLAAPGGAVFDARGAHVAPG